MGGNFEIYVSNKNRKHYFRLKAGNGELILGSLGYATRTGCLTGVESVRRNCLDDACYECLTASNAKHYFNIKSGNGQVIATSQMYVGSSDRDNGIAGIRKNAPEADIIDISYT